MSIKSPIIPTLRYRDARAAIEWLQRVFGFTLHFATPDEGPTVDHAQLTLGEGMIMLGSVRDEDDGPVGSTTVQPGEAGGVTQAPYVVLSPEELAAHYDRAVAEGAEIVSELADQPYGGANYSAKDPDGHVWHFGSYNPWA